MLKKARDSLSGDSQDSESLLRNLTSSQSFGSSDSGLFSGSSDVGVLGFNVVDLGPPCIDIGKRAASSGVPERTLIPSALYLSLVFSSNVITSILMFGKHYILVTSGQQHPSEHPPGLSFPTETLCDQSDHSCNSCDNSSL